MVNILLVGPEVTLYDLTLEFVSKTILGTLRDTGNKMLESGGDSSLVLTMDFTPDDNLMLMKTAREVTTPKTSAS